VLAAGPHIRGSYGFAAPPRRLSAGHGGAPELEQAREVADRQQAGEPAVLDHDAATTEERDKEFVRRERRFGAFSRSMTLPDGVGAKEIKATTHDGVLELTIPLPKEAAAEPVTITPTAGK